MEYQLIRTHKYDACTIGELHRNGLFVCYTLEDKVRQDGVKVPGETAIPYGRYPLSITFSNRFQRLLPAVDHVPGFVGIRMHGGNTDRDTHGCVLVAHKVDMERHRIYQQAEALVIASLHADLQDGECWLEVRDEAAKNP